MRAYFESELQEDIRMQPWGIASYDKRGKYYDFKKHPKLIRTVLEDFKSYEKYESVDLFYALIDFLNGPDSAFETNDTRLKVNRQNHDGDRIDKKFVLSNDISVFFRDLKLNLAGETGSSYLNWLIEDVIREFDLRPTPHYGLIKLYLMPTQFTHAPVSQAAQYGHSVIYKIVTWGDCEEEQFENHKLVLQQLLSYFRELKPPANVDFN